MLKVIIVGDRPLRMQLWEFLSMQGVVEEFAFIDTDSSRFVRKFMGLETRTVDWLLTVAGRWDRIVLANEDAVSIDQLINAGWDADNVLSIPASVQDRAVTASWIREHFPDPLQPLLDTHLSYERPAAVGIFGTGAGGVKVWEALVMIDACEPAWFADNDERKQGGKFFGLNVISPALIQRMEFAAIIIASMHRAPISGQLLSLGIERDKMIVPTLVGPMEQLQRYLTSAIKLRIKHGSKGIQ